MELDRLCSLLKKYVPESHRDLWDALSMLSDTMVEAKDALSQALFTAHAQGDFTSAHELLDAQEELTRQILYVESLYKNTYGSGFDPHHSDDEVYDIANVPVTYRKPTSFTWQGQTQQVSTWKNLLNHICDSLYSQNPAILRSMAAENSSHVKLSVNAQDLKAPREIANSGLYIETNYSASTIRNMILMLLKRYGADPHSLTIVLKQGLYGIKG